MCEIPQRVHLNTCILKSTLTRCDGCILSPRCVLLMWHHAISRHAPPSNGMSEAFDQQVPKRRIQLFMCTRGRGCSSTRLRTWHWGSRCTQQFPNVRGSDGVSVIFALLAESERDTNTHALLYAIIKRHWLWDGRRSDSKTPCCFQQLLGKGPQVGGREHSVTCVACLQVTPINNMCIV